LRSYAALRDSTHTLRAFAPRTCRAALLFAAALFALNACASAALAQAQSGDEQDKVPKETSFRRVPSVNVAPWVDLARKGKELFDAGRLGPDTRLDVTAKGERADDGTLKPESVVLTWAVATDETAASLAQQFFNALGESRALGALEGTEGVSVRLRLDEANAFLNVAAEMPSEARAKELSNGYGIILRLKAAETKGTLEGEFYDAVRLASDGRLLTLSFEMPKEKLGGIITETLAKSAAAARPKN